MTTNYEVRYAANPDDVKHYDTSRLRKEHLVTNLFVPDEVNMVYSMYDRLIVGGAMPVKDSLYLEAIEPLKAKNFLDRREIGIFNVGGFGSILVNDSILDLDYKEAAYIGADNESISFISHDPKHPAKFYFNSTPAHCSYPNNKISRDDTFDAVEMGTMESANHRVINKMLVSQVLPTCQLQMGMTELKPGSVWNSMPAHTHNRRMEAYFYFELGDSDALCHFMGEPTETRHIWMKNEQAVISPQWSIHSGVGTSNYTFIWGMGGENLDYSDQDFVKNTDLR